MEQIYGRYLLAGFIKRESAMRERPIKLEHYKLTPNKMQVAFVQNILQLRRNHVQKALLTSSAGERVIIVIPHESAVNTRASAA